MSGFSPWRRWIKFGCWGSLLDVTVITFPQRQTTRWCDVVDDVDAGMLWRQFKFEHWGRGFWAPCDVIISSDVASSWGDLWRWGSRPRSNFRPPELPADPPEVRFAVDVWISFDVIPLLREEDWVIGVARVTKSDCCSCRCCCCCKDETLLLTLFDAAILCFSSSGNLTNLIVRVLFVPLLLWLLWWYCR